MFDVDVIIAGYNTKDLTCRCLGSIFKKRQRARFKCYYVDDGSSDGSADCVEKRYPQVEVIRNKSNMGLGYSYNRGIEKGSSEFIALINSDVEVNSDWLDGLVEHLKEHPDVGAAAGKIFTPHGELQKELIARRLPGLLNELIGITFLDRIFKYNKFFGRYRMMYMDYEKGRKVDQPSGTYLVIRRKALNEAGLFDEHFQFYYVDVNLSYRLNKAGWKQMYVPLGSVVHFGTPYGGATISKIGSEMITKRIRDKQLFFRKNYGLIRYYLLKPIIILEVLEKSFLTLLATLLTGGEKKKIAKMHFWGFLKAYKYCFGSISIKDVSAKKKIIMVAPFGLEPFGTVKSRMLPIARSLKGYDISVVIPPIFDVEQSAREYREGDIGIYNIRVFRKFSIWHVPILTLRMIRKVLWLKGDIIHVFKPKGMSGFVAMFFIIFGRKPVILDTDDLEGEEGWNAALDYPGWAKKMIDFQEKWLARHSSAVTVASRALVDKMKEFGAKERNIYYLPNSIENEKIGATIDSRFVKEKHGFKEMPLILLYTRFFEFDLNKIIDIARQVKTASDARFLIAGKGPRGEEAEFLKLARDSGLEDMFVYTGWLEAEELASYIAAADVVIHPYNDNQINRFKSPRKILEIMSMGKPVVVDAVGQNREYIVHRESGFLANSLDTEEFSGYVTELLKDRNLRTRVGENAKNRVLEHFNWDKNIKILEDAYARCGSLR